MGNLVSTLIIQLTDKLSGPAKQAAAGLDAVEKAIKRTEQAAKSGELAGFTGRFSQQLSRLGVGARDVDRVAQAFERFKTSAGIAGNSLNWTRTQATQVRTWELQMVSSLRHVSAEEERAMRVGRGANPVAASGKHGSGALGILGVMATHEATEKAIEALHTYREFDKERRFGKAVMGLTDEEQKPLVDQAIHMGATTKFNDIQVLEAQRELAARGLKRDQIMGMMKPAANLGQALDLSLPDAVKQMEGAIFGFKKDISSLDAALASATQTADVQVKAAKISGMKPEDLVQLYKFGATPARLAGISEQSLLAFGGILKKANIGGDEFGTAFRALVASLTSPTRKAKESLLANGLDFKNYQKPPAELAVDPFVKNVAAQYGVQLNAEARAGLANIFKDKSLIGDPAKFAPAVVGALEKTLGKQDAKSLRSIAGAANRYRDASVRGININALIADLLKKIPGNLQLANSIFGSKQGGRIATALSDPEVLNQFIEMITGESEGYAEKIATERMSGFDGAVSRLEGSLKNLDTAVGRAWDNSGSGGALTGITDIAGKVVQSFAELNKESIQLITALGGIATAWVGAKSIGLLAGGFGLKGSAFALDGSAAALTRAAGLLAAGGSTKLGEDAIKTAAPAGIGLAAILRSKIGMGAAGVIAALAAMKEDSETGNHVRTWFRSALGPKGLGVLPDIKDDPNEPAPWLPGGAWHKRWHRPLHGTVAPAESPENPYQPFQLPDFRRGDQPLEIAPQGSARGVQPTTRDVSESVHVIAQPMKQDTSQGEAEPDSQPAVTVRGLNARAAAEHDRLKALRWSRKGVHATDQPTTRDVSESVHVIAQPMKQDTSQGEAEPDSKPAVTVRGLNARAAAEHDRLKALRSGRKGVHVIDQPTPSWINHLNPTVATKAASWLGWGAARAAGLSGVAAGMEALSIPSWLAAGAKVRDDVKRTGGVPDGSMGDAFGLFSSLQPKAQPAPQAPQAQQADSQVGIPADPAAAAAAGQQFGAAFREGMKPELAKAVEDALGAVQKMLNALTFTANPLISPTMAPAAGATQHMGSLDAYSVQTSYADYGLEVA